MITREMVDNLYVGQVLLHVDQKNSDGTPVRWKITSIKTWKTRPDDFRIGLKHGLRDYAYITPGINGNLLTTNFPLHCSICGEEISFEESYFRNQNIYCYEHKSIKEK